MISTRPFVAMAGGGRVSIGVHLRLSAADNPVFYLEPKACR
jgi:hypothetical protein